MKSLYSNGPTSNDSVRKPFEDNLRKAKEIFLAAPYFTIAEPIVAAANAGKRVQLLIGLNSSTSPEAISKIYNVPNLTARYLTHRFHAKIFIFDDLAFIGSANITDGGLIANREAVIRLDPNDDAVIIQDTKELFQELWESALEITLEKLNQFRQARRSLSLPKLTPDEMIENIIGRAEPNTINAASKHRTSQQLFLESLRRQIQSYRMAFEEISEILVKQNLRRPELAEIGLFNEANRFLNWVRLTKAIGGDSWKFAPVLSQNERKAAITGFAQDWVSQTDSKVPQDYIDWLQRVQTVFASIETIDSASKDELTQALMSLHAFAEQLRFVKGGLQNLPSEFWTANSNDMAKVKKSISYLLFGSEDFTTRLYKYLFTRHIKLAGFGKSCALEIFGTIKPNEAPPMNGRMAKALKFLGYDVLSL